jgi:phosphate transport system permease protein
MSPPILLATILALALIGFVMGRSRALAASGGHIRSLHSQPNYYGAFIFLWVLLPAALLALAWLAVEPAAIRFLVLDRVPDSVFVGMTDAQINLFYLDILNLAVGAPVSREATDVLVAAASHYSELAALSHWILFALGAGLAAFCFYATRRQIHADFRARNHVERIVTGLMIVCSTIAILTTVGIVLSLLFESLRFFMRYEWHQFLFGLQWSPQTAIREDQVGSSGAFGAVPLFTGTLLIASIAMIVAVPVGLMSAIYLSEYAPRKVRDVVKPALEVLAGIPTVVFGFFAILTVAPAIRDWGAAVGLDISANSALAAGVVMGIMIIPFISSLSDDVINAVPQSLRDGALGLGSTKSEVIRQVVFPAALPGIVGGILLAVSRAIGETMIVVMAAGMQANLTANPFAAVTTVTVQIAALLTGDTEFESAKTLSAFALGLVLFGVTLILNVIALKIVQRYREKYD